MTAILALAMGIFVWQCLALPNVLIDDSYITFSYSKNLALGNGPVYSHGVRSEGYSNFLWMVLVALPLTVARHIDPVWAARLMGAPFVALLGWSTYRLGTLATGSRTIGALTVVLLSFGTDFATAYLSGLETICYAALFTASFAAMSSWWNSKDERAHALLPWLATGAALSRIDGFLLLALVLGLELARSRLLRPRPRLWSFCRWAGPPVLVYAAWFLWRWSYYGLPLPSTYYAKALIPTLLPDRGFDYVKAELTSSALFLAFFSATVLLARGRAWALPLLIAVIAQLAYVIKVGGDWMPFGRFVMPAVPLLVVLLVGGLVEAVRAIPAAPALGRKAAAVAALIIAALVASTTGGGMMVSRTASWA